MPQSVEAWTHVGRRVAFALAGHGGADGLTGGSSSSSTDEALRAAERVDGADREDFIAAVFGHAPSAAAADVVTGQRLLVRAEPGSR